MGENNSWKEIGMTGQGTDMDVFNLFDQFPDMLFILDMNGTMLMVNDTVIRRLGYAREELIGNSVLMVHPVERRAEAAEIVRRMIGGQAEHCPIPVLCRDGRLIPVETRVVPGRWNDRDVLLGVCKDISDVKFSEEKFAKTFHASAAAMALSSYDDGRLIDVNDAFLSVLGYSREEVIGKTTSELNIFTTPPDRSRALRDLIRQGRLKNFEASIRDKRGELHYGLFSAETIYIQDSLCLLTTMMDITERRKAEETLQESEENFRAFFATIDDLIIASTLEGRIVYANPAVSRKLGFDPSELTTMTILDLHPGEVRREAEDIFAAMGRGERESCPLPLASKDGRLIPVETRVWFGRWNGEKCVIGVSKDLTAEQEAQQRFERLFRNNPAPMALSSASHGEFIDVNDAFLAALGYARKEVIGRTPADLDLFIHPDRQRAAAERIMREERIDSTELQVRRRDGGILNGLFSGELISSQGQRYFLTVMIDVTERLRVEQALRDSEKRWQFALEGAGDGVWDWDATTNRVHYSRQWKTMLGYSEQEIGDALDEWERRVHPDDRDAVHVEIGRHFRGETEIYQSEHRVLCKDGSYKWILDRGKIIEWTEDGKPRRVIGTHTDISERKKSEEELAGHRSRLEELVKERTAELEDKTQILEELNTALKVLLRQRDEDRKELEERYVSNIKNFILPYSEKLKKTRLDERQQSYLDIMETHFEEIISPLLKSLHQFNLTPTEAQIASLIKDGKSTKEIARLMTVSTATVDNHRKSIRKKLNINNVKANLRSKLSTISE